MVSEAVVDLVGVGCAKPFLQNQKILIMFEQCKFKLALAC